MTEDMDYADLDVPWGDTEEAFRRYNRIRWAIVIIYVALVLTVSSLPLFLEWDEMSFVYLILGVTFGGMIVIFVVLFKPYIKRPDKPMVKDGLIVESEVVRKLRPGETYRDVKRFDLIMYIMVPVIVLLVALMVIIRDPMTIAIQGAVVALLVILALIFNSLVVEVDRQTLSFHFGPIGRDIPLGEIDSIRAVAVHATKEFMGWGIRVGPDGTIGYIASGNVGVRLAISDGKEYVLTVNDPQGMVEYVRAAKAEAE
ncbi:MAG: hypothetical protein JSW25_07345 [Thermoplasmata archaeon]|nr:MAG: hypothetical protein JSW25_07345 [Thermoplasmata archaeon]